MTSQLDQIFDYSRPSNELSDDNELDLQQILMEEARQHPVYNKFNREDYSLLCKDLAISAINQGYQIVRNGFYVDILTINRFLCSRCIQYKGDI